MKTEDEVAESLSWSGSKISRIETARTGVKVADLHKLLDLYDVPPEQRPELIKLSREGKMKGWWESYSHTLPEEYAALIGLEAEADSVFCWSPELVHGLLQTEDYARAVIRSHMRSTDPIPPGAVERRVEARMQRQQVIFREQPMKLYVVLDEAVLLRRFGDAEVMRGQLGHLLTLSQLPNVTVRVLRLDGPHPIGTGAFVMLRFGPVDQTTLHDVVYIEQLNASSLYIEDEKDTFQFQLAFDELAGAALSDTESRALISSIKQTNWK